MSNNNGFQNESTPVELRAIESALAELGERDRGSAPAGLESRLEASTRHMLTAEDAPVVIARIGHRMSLVSKLRIAASVAIVGGLAAVFLSNGPSSSLSPIAARSLEEDMNYVLELRSADEGLAAMGDKIDTLFMDTSNVGDSLKTDPATTLLEGAT